MQKTICQQTAWAKPAAALGTLAAAISALYAPVTFAAEASARLDEVVVSARRREEMAQDVPISMTVMTEEFLKTNNINKVEDLGTKVPSMRISAASGSVNEPIVSLRGQRQGEATYNQDPAAPIYFNEIVIAPTQGSNMGLYDLEGLQVLKGPQGTLFGRNSTGGALLVTPKRPGSVLGGYVEVKAGDYNLWGFEGAVDVPLNDMLTTRISAHKLDRDGYQENIADNALHGRDYRDEHSEGARLSVNFAHDAFNTLSVFAYDENHMSSAIPVVGAANPQAGITASSALAAYPVAVAEQIARDNPWKVKSDLDGEEAVRNIFFSNTSEYEFNDEMTVKNVFGYRSVHFATSSDIDGTALPLLGTPTDGELFTASANAITFDPRLNTVDTEFYSDELQLFGTALDDRLDWLGGLYWSKLQGTEDKLSKNGPFTYDSVLSDILNTSYGIMGEATYAFTDQWSLTAGARNSWDEREMTIGKWTPTWPNTNARIQAQCGMYAEGQPPTATGIKDADCKRKVDEKFEKPTVKFSLNYKPEANTLIYGSVATGYRAGGFNTRGLSDGTLQPYDQENVVTYELGHKKDWDFSGVSVRTSVAAYFQNYEDIQNTVSFAEGGRVVTRTENAGKAEISGVEFELTVKPTDNLRFDASYSFIDAQYTNRESTIDPVTVAGPSDAFIVDSSGDDFTYIPKQSLTASTTYTLPLDANIGEVSLTAGIYWQDEMSTHPNRNEFNLYGWTAANVATMTEFSTVDAYSVYNLRANWRGVMGSSFDVAAYVDNVTDEEYVLGGLNAVESLGIGDYHYGAPRTVGASVKYSF